MSTKGRISTEHTVFCGLCGHFQQEGIYLKGQFEQFIREAGWTKTLAHGWVCPVCKPKRAKQRLRKRPQ